MQENKQTSVSFWQALKVWFKIGLLSFGGPAGQISMMHQLLVDEKRFISENRFLHALNYCMLLPGPEAQQLTVYLGWLMHKTWGGVVAGVLFVLPGALVMLLLSILYAKYQEVTLITALFYGIKATVFSVVLMALIKIAKKILDHYVLYIIAFIAFIAIYFLSVSFPLIIISAGLTGYIGGKFYPNVFSTQKKQSENAKNDRYHVDEQLDNQTMQAPSKVASFKVLATWVALWGLPLLILALFLGSQHVYVQEGLFFSKSAVVTFGGAYAVLAYVAQQAVANYAWLKPGEMLDGLGLAETTPGPLIMVVQFVGFMGAYRNPGMLDPILAGCLGAMITTWVTFIPCFLFIFLGAPYIEYLRSNQSLNTALSAITAAVVGVVLNLAVWLSTKVIFAQSEMITWSILQFNMPNWESVDPILVLLVGITFIMMRTLKIGMIQTIIFGAVTGAAFYYL